MSNGELTGIVNLPVSGISTEPNTLPFESVRIAVEPASPLPVTDAPSDAIVTSVGWVGFVVSGAVAVVVPELLPALSVTFTETSSPFVNAVLSGTENVPFAGTTALPNTLPSASVTVTVEPGSA